MEQNEFIDFLKKGWAKNSSELQNPDFINYSDNFFKTRAPVSFFGKEVKPLAECFFYREKILTYHFQLQKKTIIERLYDQYTCADVKWLTFDPASEVVLMVYDNGARISDPLCFLVTNTTFYYRLVGGKGWTDTKTKTNRIPLQNIKGKVEVKGWSSHELIFDGNILGGIDLNQRDDKKAKRMLEDYFQGISMNRDTFFSSQNKTTDTNSKDLMSSLKQLKELLDQGIINESEFNQKKAEILSKM